MKRTSYIVLLSFLLLGARVGVVAQDYARLSERSIMGTARYVGMGGAMTAIGGDPSSVLDNPAGLGLYQRTEMLVTFDETLDYSRQKGADKSRFRHLFMCPHVSLIFSVPTYNANPKGVQAYNFMVSYHRRQTYNRTFEAYGLTDTSLGSIMPMIDIPVCENPLHDGNKSYLEEYGNVTDFAFNWSLNIGHQWYAGLGVHILNYMLSSESEYNEQFDEYNLSGQQLYTRNVSSLRLSGMGCSFSAGVIYRPLQWLRLGLSIQSPSVGNLRTYTAGTLYAQTDSLRISYAPDLNFNDRNFHMPLHVSSSVAFQFGAYGMLALQYDYRHLQYQPDEHSLKLGLEVIPVMGMYVNAGYVYESNFKSVSSPVALDPKFERQDTYSVLPRYSQYASLAVGYRGQHIIAQVAYQYRWQKIDYYAHPAASPYDMRTQTHRIVLTLGWHHN